MMSLAAIVADRRPQEALATVERREAVLPAVMAQTATSSGIRNLTRFMTTPLNPPIRLVEPSDLVLELRIGAAAKRGLRPLLNQSLTRA